MVAVVVVVVAVVVVVVAVVVVVIVVVLVLVAVVVVVGLKSAMQMIRAVSSDEPDPSKESSKFKATELTSAVWCLNSLMTAPVATLMSRMMLSQQPVARTVSPKATATV
jgi:hypothetical protein